MPQSQDFWILRPFNPVFLVSFAAFLALLALAALLLRDKSERCRQLVLADRLRARQPQPSS